MKAGFVTLVGRPNVGKSTLLNTILERKLSITSNKVQTTRNIIEGIYNDDDTQIVFIDTPGIHKPKAKFGNLLNGKSYSKTNDVDLILFVIDAEYGFGRGDEFILNQIKEKETPIIVLLNKVDKMKKEVLLGQIGKLSEIYPFKEIIPISALKGDNVDKLVGIIKNYLPDRERIYDEDVITNVSRNFYVSEIVREKILRLTSQEIPHCVTCMVETIEESESMVRIQMLIIIDRESLKKIIIGKNGQMIKEIGTKARIDLEEYFGKKVYLESFVKTIKNWRSKDEVLREFGLKDE